MVIHSMTLDTEEKVKAIYGGTTWIQHSGYVLRGASSGVTANSAVKTGGSDDAVVVSHSHKPSNNNLFCTAGGTSDRVYGKAEGFYGGADLANTTNTVGESGTNKNIPNYKSVYIWERTV